MDCVLRHKIVQRSKLPFNTLLRELKAKVKRIPAVTTPTVQRMGISARVNRRITKRGVTREMIENTFYHGQIDARRRLSTSTPTGGRRLLGKHETRRETVLKRYKGVSIRYTLSPLRLVDAYLARK
jgi:hypothetical protein